MRHEPHLNVSPIKNNIHTVIANCNNCEIIIAGYCSKLLTSLETVHFRDKHNRSVSATLQNCFWVCFSVWASSFIYLFGKGGRGAIINGRWAIIVLIPCFLQPPRYYFNNWGRLPAATYTALPCLDDNTTGKWQTRAKPRQQPQNLSNFSLGLEL